jgi:curli biogenesis system outer membrane secretion channel CsgG
VQRIIGKCTAKDPDDRYQGMRDVVVDLRAARRRLESSTGSGAAATPVAATGVARANRSTLMLSAALAIAAITAGYFWLNARPKLPVVSPSGKPSVAVLYFENNTGDASLDWMRTGLADMMVTDLSQSSAFEVLGTDRVYQILQELKRQDDRAISADVVKAIAGRAAVDTC